MHRPLVIANWKMNTSLADASILASQIKSVADQLEVDIVLCPPFVWLYPVAEIIYPSNGFKPKNLKLGAQNMWFLPKGPITGEVSPAMLKGLAEYVLVGHSERRFYFHETDALINDKLKAALEFGLKPVLCVGELKKNSSEKSGRKRSATGEMDIVKQLEEAIYGVEKEDIEKVVLVYEPVWAISLGTAASRNAADGGYANFMIEKLREVLSKKYGRAVAERVKILYGGSVDEDNVKEFIYQPEIDGVLVGGASLKYKEFIKICREAVGRE